MLSRRSISSILTAYLFSLSAAILLVAGSIGFFIQFRTKQQAIAQEQQIAAQAPVEAVRNFIADKVNILKASIWISDIQMLNPESKTRVLQTLCGMRPSFKQILILDTLGLEVARSSRRSLNSGKPQGNSYFSPAVRSVRNNTSYLSPAYVDPETQEPAILIGLPITDVYGRYHGSLLAELNLKFMWELMRDLRVGIEGTAYVVDRSGALIAFSDATRVLRGDNVGEISPVAEFIAHPDSAISGHMHVYRGISGDLVVGTHVALRSPDWAVVVEVPLLEAYGTFVRDMAINFALIIALVGLAAMLGRRISRQFSRPIINLAETASRIAAGERGLKAEIAGPLETAHLAEAFNTLNDELEDRVVQRTEQLARANKELEAFSYSVSHDLRAPLRAIDGFARILEEDYGEILDVEGKRVCLVISDETKRMGQLIDDLLAFSRWSRTSMRRSEIDMATMATEVFEQITTPEERAGIEWTIRPLPNIYGDSSMMRQVWVNLLSNAIKFTSKSPHPAIEVSGAQGAVENTYSIRDNGAGFDMQHASKLFGVFQRLHSTREFAGTGVGLAIVQRIVQRHGGRVWGEGTPARGATFHFTIPSRSNHE